ncbi:hypothetical protein BDQ17DRAFT_1427664 [Cyathus striatus]|nr:hypothetical protein BDQ17DRAFT_1427664 [Cyathus striatus]
MPVITVTLSPPEDKPLPTKPFSLEMPVPGPSKLRDDAPVSTIDVFGRSAPSTIPLGSTIFSSLPPPPVSPTDSSFSTGTRSKKSSVSRIVMTALESSRPQLFTRKKKGSKSENEIKLVPLGAVSVADDLQRIGTGSSSTPSQKAATGTLRVVGRGGSGSRPRVTTGASEPAGKTSISSMGSHPQSHSSLDIERQPSSQSGNSASGIRVVGRGGTGSRPRRLAPDSEEVDTSLLNKLVAQELPPKTYRVSGRGGVGSRPRPVKPKSKFETKSNPGSMLKFKPKWKGKAKAPSLKSLPVYDIRATRRSTDSNTSVSTIHFAENGSRPQSMAPTSVASSIKDGSSVPSTPGFTSVSSTIEDLPLTPLTPAGSIASDVSDSQLSVELTPPSIRAKRRLDKLTKTLGDLPPNDALYDSLLLQERQSKFDKLPPIKTDSLPSNIAAIKSRRRTSFNSFSSFLLNNRRQSGQSVSTITDDVHHFPFMDDLSDGWGEIRDRSTRASMRSDMSSDVASPIIFAPPTPTSVPVKRRSASPVSVSSEPLPTTPTPEDDCEDEDASEYISSLPTPTLGRSHSFSHTSRMRGERTHGHSVSVSQRRPDTPFSLDHLPAKANWLNPPPEEETIVIARSSTVPQQRWEGQWNGDLQEVIRSLRNLR